METVNKIWGKEIIVENNKKYCMKFLEFNYRWMNSWHKHEIKDEMFYVTDGLFYCQTFKDMEYKEGLLYVGDSIRIEPGTLHRLCGLQYYNKVIEVSTTFKNNDVRRFLDAKEIYGEEETNINLKGRYIK